VLILLVTWWHTPFVHLQGRVQNNDFDTEGVVPLAYGLFALGIALAVGAFWRRTAPALVIAFGGYFAARLFVDTWLRQRFLTPATATWPMRAQGPDLRHAWVLSQYPSDEAGHSVAPLLGGCIRSVGGNRAAVSPGCVAQHGGGYSHAVFFPPHDFWPLQGIETALFGGVALVLIAFAAWWTHSRAA
jgi:hypothetical protein